MRMILSPLYCLGCKPAVAGVNNELKFLLDWSNKNELFIHPKKSEYVIFGTAMKLNQFDSDNISDVYLGDQCKCFLST